MALPTFTNIFTSRLSVVYAGRAVADFADYVCLDIDYHYSHFSPGFCKGSLGEPDPLSWLCFRFLCGEVT